MTTETIIAAKYGLTGTPLVIHNNHNITTFFHEGRTAREIGNAFLSNPYTRMSSPWRDWRAGWLREDLGSKDRDLY